MTAAINAVAVGSTLDIYDHDNDGLLSAREAMQAMGTNPHDHSTQTPSTHTRSTHQTQLPLHSLSLVAFYPDLTEQQRLQKIAAADIDKDGVLSQSELLMVGVKKRMQFERCGGSEENRNK